MGEALGGSSGLGDHDSELLHSSGIELAYVENDGGVVQAFTTAIVLVAGLTLIVPPSERPVWVEANMTVDITASPAAGTTGLYTAFIAPADSGPFYAIDKYSIEGGGGSGGEFILKPIGRVGPVEEELTLNVYCFKANVAGHSGSIRNNNVNGSRSFHVAFSR